MLIELCKISEIEDPGSKGFNIDHQGRDIDLFVVHKDGAFHAFINSCPHTGANLEWLEDQFLDMDKAFIQCATHDALFEVDSGLCVAGPCVDDHLTAIELELKNDTIVAHL